MIPSPDTTLAPSHRVTSPVKTPIRTASMIAALSRARTAASGAGEVRRTGVGSSTGVAGTTGVHPGGGTEPPTPSRSVMAVVSASLGARLTSLAAVWLGGEQHLDQT